MTDLTDRQREYLEALPQPSYQAWGAAVGSSESSAEEMRRRLTDAGHIIEKVDGQWRNTANQHPGDDDDDPLVSDNRQESDADDADGESDDAEASLPDLDDIEAQVIRSLPATVEELAADLSECDPHYALEAVRDTGIDIGYDQAASKYYIADERSDELRAKTHLSLSAKTKRAKKALRDEQAILDRLPDTQPLSIQNFSPDPGKETMVAALGDLHFGDIYHNDRGDVVYDREVAHAAVDQFIEKVVRHKRQWAADFDECVIPILGDIATGTEIYKTQKNEIQDLLSAQIKNGSQALTRVVTTLREHFEAVRVYCVVGNHGFQSPSAARGSNTDLTCYYWMRDAVRREGYDDVEITIAENSHHLNFEVRGWNFHIRHGQDGQQQIDETARSEADWRGWRDKHQFDVAIRGHYHVPSLHWILNRYPAVTVPSPAPGGEFADRIGAPDVSTPADRETERKLGYCFGVSEERRMTDSRMTDAG
jgi:predicted phosphodiesterase